jgi:hypothetical protein
MCACACVRVQVGARRLCALPPFGRTGVPALRERSTALVGGRWRRPGLDLRGLAKGSRQAKPGGTGGGLGAVSPLAKGAVPGDRAPSEGTRKRLHIDVVAQGGSSDVQSPYAPVPACAGAGVVICT